MTASRNIRFDRHVPSLVVRLLNKAAYLYAQGEVSALINLARTLGGRLVL